MHKILEYLFYKIQVLTRYMDTSMYLNIHVPFIMSTVLLFYLADIAIIYLSLIHTRAHETKANLVCRLLLEKKKKKKKIKSE